KEFQRAWAKVVAQAWCDDSFRVALMTDPARALREHGADIPADARLSLTDEPLASLGRSMFNYVPQAQAAGVGTASAAAPRVAAGGGGPAGTAGGRGAVCGSAGCAFCVGSAGSKGDAPFAPYQSGPLGGGSTVGSAGTVGSVGSFCGTAGTVGTSA